MYWINTVTLSILLITETAHPATYIPFPDRYTQPSTWAPSRIENAQYTRSGIFRGNPVGRSRITMSVMISDLTGNRTEDGWYSDENVDCKTVNGNGGEHEILCEGVHLGYETYEPDLVDVQNVLRRYWETHTVKWRSAGSHSVSGDECRLKATVYVVGYGWNTYEDMVCPASTTIPVSCSISGPESLVHPSREQNNASGTVRGNWIVNCSGTTAITVTTTDDVKLRSGSNEIDSGLYIKSDGINTVDLTVDTHRSVAILSKLKSSTAEPGDYKGTGIITVSWP